MAAETITAGDSPITPMSLPSPASSFARAKQTIRSSDDQQSAIAAPHLATPDRDYNNSLHDHHLLHHEPAAGAQQTAQIPFYNTDDRRSSDPKSPSATSVYPSTTTPTASFDPDPHHRPASSVHTQSHGPQANHHSTS
ncbi:hypothetical protein ACLOJK_018994 [Asimina triloba]